MKFLLVFLLAILSIQSLRIPIQNTRTEGIQRLRKHFSKINTFNLSNLNDSNNHESLKKHKTLKNKLKKSSQIDAIGQALIQIKLSTQFGNSYEGQVQLGSNRQPLSALFDTGSSIIWFAGSECDACTQAGIQHTYDCSDSTTCKQTQKLESIKYGKGQCQGYLSKDLLTVDGKTIVDQEFLSINKLKDFPNYPGDGLIGLGSEALTHGEKTLIDNLYEQNLISQKIFAMVINPALQSYLDIGEIDKELYTGPIYYLPVQQNSAYWSLGISSLYMVSRDGQKYQIERSEDIDQWQMVSDSLVIDSGTSILTFPTNDVLAILKMLSLNGLNCRYDDLQYNQIVCDVPEDLSSFPNLGVTAEGQDGQKINMVIDAGLYVICDTQVLNICVVRVSKLDIATYAIFGDIFMQNFYSIFDVQNQQIGFASLSNSQKLQKNNGLGFISRAYDNKNLRTNKHYMKKHTFLKKEDQSLKLLQDNEGKQQFVEIQQQKKQQKVTFAFDLVLGITILFVLSFLFFLVVRQLKSNNPPHILQRKPVKKSENLNNNATRVVRQKGRAVANKK